MSRAARLAVLDQMRAAIAELERFDEDTRLAVDVELDVATLWVDAPDDASGVSSD